MNSSLPLVSVVVPNYNHGSHLQKRLDSIINQTFQDFELIILDDRSTDNSRDIIQMYADHKKVTHVSLNEQNSGSTFKQWKRGLNVARGEWIWFAESDDYADLTFLEKMIKRTVHPRIGLVYCDSHVVEGDVALGQTLGEMKNKRLQTNRWSHDYHNDGVDEIEGFLLPAGTINNASAVLFRRSVLEAVNPFDLPLRYIGDKYAYVKVLSKSDVAYVNQALNYYRNPFNKKAADAFIQYFYEQFLVFDWVYRNVDVTDWKAFYRGFYSNTQNSIFTGWSMSKIELYGRLARTNAPLFIRCVGNNFVGGMARTFGLKNK